jgi:hypothetical protein
MGKVVMRHKVKDYAAWRPRFDADLGRQNAAGLTHPQVLRADGDPNELVLVWDCADATIARNFLTSPDLKEVMIEAGVLDKPSIYFPA